MQVLEEKKKKPTSPDSPLKKKRSSRCSDLWLTKQHLVLAKNLQSLSTPSKDAYSKTPNPNLSKIDPTLLLSDELLLNILAKLPDSQRKPNSLVCKRWLNLQGRLVRTLKVLDWDFLESGRLILRFPNLNHIDLVNGCLASSRNSGILVNHTVVSLHFGSRFSSNWRVCDDILLSVEVVDRGLKTLANGCHNLRKLAVINASELGLLNVAEECATLQELELHKCNDKVLRGIAAYENLQVLRLIGNLHGFYTSLVSDIGLTILAQGCKRLVKLELWGCEGSFDGVKAIGQCCQMLEELTLCDHRMEAGWLAAISFCENLKTLKFLSCKGIDPAPGPDEYLGSCPSLERLHLHKCHVREKKSLRALFRVCEAVREVVFQDCWGLDTYMFSQASVCRRVRILSLGGCSLLTTEGLESVILSWKELENLKVESCRNMKDSEISTALSTLFSALKELKWRPDNRSHLASSLAGTGIGKRGGKFFKKTSRESISIGLASALTVGTVNGHGMQL